MPEAVEKNINKEQHSINLKWVEEQKPFYDMSPSDFESPVNPGENDI